MMTLALTEKNPETVMCRGQSPIDGYERAAKRRRTEASVQVSGLGDDLSLSRIPCFASLSNRNILTTGCLVTGHQAQVLPSSTRT